MKLAIRNQQAHKRPGRRALGRLLRFFLQRAPFRKHAAPDEVTLVLTDNQRIRQLSRLYFKRDQVTDVISFRYRPVTGDVRHTSGDIIVNVERAGEYGPRYGGPRRELALYIAHGVDHLTGADDDAPVERQRMRRRELRWLAAAARAGLLRGITT